MLAAGGGMVGGLLGALVGAAGETENWRTVEKRTIRLRVPPRRHGGMSASVSIRF